MTAHQSSEILMPDCTGGRSVSAVGVDSVDMVFSFTWALGDWQVYSITIDRPMPIVNDFDLQKSGTLESLIVIWE
jgi:hypothetical protein